MGGYIRAIAHANRGDLKTINAVGIPPIGSTKKEGLLFCRQFSDEVRDGRIQKIARHGRKSRTRGNV